MLAGAASFHKNLPLSFPKHRIIPAILAVFGLLPALYAYADGVNYGGGFHPNWIEVWGASPQQPIDPITGPSNPLITLNGQTIREVVRISAGAQIIRLRLSNEYTNASTAIGKVRVALSKANGTASSAIVPGSSRIVTFGGKQGLTLAPNALVISDPVDLPVSGLTSLAVSIYVSNGTEPTTPHSLGQQTAYIVDGDQTGAANLNSATTTTSRYLLSGIDAEVLGTAAAIVTLGDSITDGYHSTVDADHRWPDYLADRLQKANLYTLSVANEGISGNRLLQEGIGPNALSRFDRDVLSRPGVRYITVLEGINDIGIPNLIPNSGTPADAADIIGAYRQLIARAHELGILIYGCTLTPFVGAAYQTAAGEATREQVNQWIRNSQEFDAVIDFDKAVRDPSNPAAFLPAYDSGDHLHPNDAGYQAMANAVNLNLFTKQ
jgi:lysophospholipase L1-like esterase